MIGWLRRRRDRDRGLVDDPLDVFDPSACPDCDGGYVTSYDPFEQVDKVYICKRCSGTGRRNGVSGDRDSPGRRGRR